MNVEEVSMKLIAHSGDSRTNAFNALKAAKEGDFAKAEELLKLAKEDNVLAHKAQTDLLFAEANDEHVEVNVLLVHAQDHFMTSMLAIELIEEMIRLEKIVSEKEGK